IVGELNQQAMSLVFEPDPGTAGQNTGFGFVAPPNTAQSASADATGEVALLPSGSGGAAVAANLAPISRSAAATANGYELHAVKEVLDRLFEHLRKLRKSIEDSLD